MGAKIIVEIIHKAHPFFGQKGVLLKVGRGKDPKAKIRLKDGSEVEIKRSWVNFQDTPDSDPPDETEHLLDASSLLEIVKRIEEIKRQSDIVEDSPSGKRVNKAKAGSKRRTK